MVDYFKLKSGDNGRQAINYIRLGNVNLAYTCARQAWRYALRALESRPIPRRGIDTKTVRTCRRRPVKLSRNERLQLAADAGYDTWEDYRGER